MARVRDRLVLLNKHVPPGETLILSNCLTVNPPPCPWMSIRVSPATHASTFRTWSSGGLAVWPFDPLVVAWSSSRTLSHHFVKHDSTARCSAASCLGEQLMRCGYDRHAPMVDQLRIAAELFSSVRQLDEPWKSFISCVASNLQNQHDL